MSRHAITGHQVNRHLKAGPAQVYRALTQRIPEWWSSDFEGLAAQLGDEFTVRFGDTFKTLRISTATPFEQVDWLCVGQRIVLPEGMTPLRNESEWVGQTIRWTLRPEGPGTAISFYHEGLTPESECWAVCEPGWDQTLESLVLLLETGAGRPFKHLDDEHLAAARAKQAGR